MGQLRLLDRRGRRVVQVLLETPQLLGQLEAQVRQVQRVLLVYSDKLVFKVLRDARARRDRGVVLLDPLDPMERLDKQDQPVLPGLLVIRVIRVTASKEIRVQRDEQVLLAGLVGQVPLV